MQDLYDNLTEMCEYISDEIATANKKIKASGNKLTSGDLDYVDKLTHALKSIKTTKAMMEAEEGYGSDYRMPNYASYATRNMNRDSRGRYSRDMNPHYARSYDSDMVMELRELMEKAPNSQVRTKFQQFIDEVENMR